MAIITEIHGNIFDTESEVLVNSVNCVGIMGAGIALECSYRFPGIMESYKRACDSKQLKPGKLLLYPNGEDPTILCFPTKVHWKDKSQLGYLEDGLRKFSQTYKDKGISSIAFPQLGCDRGGLEWASQVRPLMYDRLENLEDLRVEIYLFDPAGSDRLFDEFKSLAHGMSVDQIMGELNLKRKNAERLRETLDRGNVTNMFGLQKVKGIGKETLTQVYAFASGNGAQSPSSTPDGQLELELV